MSATATAQAANHTSIEQLRHHQLARMPEPDDQTVDLFSARGFALAQRVGQAFSTSNAVPPPFRQWNEKRDKNGNVTMVENPAALGNCLVAIETARSVGMSITAVMQNANVIENRLTWSGQYKIAAINASRRFTPLRFDIRNKGLIKATYKEKQGWNNELRRYNFKDVTVEVENLECIAWALPGNVAFPPQIRTLDQAKAANLPVIESAPVSMKLAVEEGWYGKSGSKWQTEMKHLMLQYRAGSFFGNIHAPDIVMGMGRTTEEAVDAIVLDVDQDGRVTNVSTEEVRTSSPALAAEVVTTDTQDETPPEQQAQAKAAGAPEEKPAAAANAAEQASTAPTVDVEGIADRLAAATSIDALDQLADQLLRPLANADVKATLDGVYSTRREELASAAEPKPAAATSRRARASSTSME
ncbi:MULTISPECIES: hypothetical protein [unclassified Variovorax]|uniref:hypothetical protein n=1 Tax=unclassified Variovorax TaxID=663243 RepID=UPI00076DD640|nr:MULTISPECIES: hypothetical protein [unclassified Variovorax]KWT89309.1 hypothetical protein APY03_3388 [Variovorax sp. WDL1]PNG56486.1 hypothetical protein CHC07_02903 [Variovorax sp. B4]PNG57909.1 hypothetical protein CHC06_02905 [Variovorax sp. B2]VTV09628.1 hypothetical protein WDL1CHR_00721 [Variovorax sp. WDL1]